VKRHRHPVVRKDLLHDLRHAREDFPDVEDRGKRPQQLLGRLQVVCPLALCPKRLLQRLEILGVVDGERDLVGDERQEFDLARIVSTPLAASHDKDAQPAHLRRQRQHAGRGDVVLPEVLHRAREAVLDVNLRKSEWLLMPDDPVGERLLRPDVGQRNRRAAWPEEESFDRVGLLVVEAEAQEAEADDVAQLRRESVKQPATIVMDTERLGDPDQRFVPLDRTLVGRGFGECGNHRETQPCDGTRCRARHRASSLFTAARTFSDLRPNSQRAHVGVTVAAAVRG